VISIINISFLLVFIKLVQDILFNIFYSPFEKKIKNTNVIHTQKKSSVIALENYADEKYKAVVRKQAHGCDK